MSRIRLTWDIGAFNPEKHYIYRSDSEISPNNLPSPIAEVGQGVNEYVDDDGIVEDETYHYFVAAEKKGLLVPAEASVDVLASSLTGAGPQDIISGDNNIGLYGEVTTDDLFYGDELAGLIGLNNGTAFNSQEPWIKMALNNEVLFIAKKPYRHNLNWNDLNNVNAIYNNQDSTIVEKGGFLYRVTLLRGANNDPISGSTAGTNDNSRTNTSEWNELIHRVHESYGEFGTYSNADLGIGSGDGRATWCQESYESSPSFAVSRGSSGTPIEYLLGMDKSVSSTARGWRPVLRLIGGS